MFHERNGNREMDNKEYEELCKYAENKGLLVNTDWVYGIVKFGFIVEGKKYIYGYGLEYDYELGLKAVDRAVEEWKRIKRIGKDG